jgi:adenylate kinase family enzyme
VTSQTIPPLATFGRRIMICGPSNSGKSTLAAAIGRKLDLPVVHLDRLHHLPRSNWVKRPHDDFVRLHDEAIEGTAWAMEGNYSSLFPQRIERATGIILLGDNRFANLRRYFVRTLFQRHRAGDLEGNSDSVKWLMIRWILFISQRSVRRYREELPRTGRPYIEIRSMTELNRLYTAWSLTRG